MLFKSFGTKTNISAWRKKSTATKPDLSKKKKLFYTIDTEVKKDYNVEAKIGLLDPLSRLTLVPKVV